MNENAIRATTSCLDYLEDLAKNKIGPQEARSDLRTLQERFPGLRLDLLWEEEAYDGSVHYDVLVHHPGEGTVSLSWCPERSLPWPLRGARRWSEADLVRVNENVLKVDQAVACLDFIWDEARIVDRLVNVCLIQEALEEEPIELSEAELQTAMDGFRRAHRLHKGEDTRRWMERHGMTHEQLENLVAHEAIVAGLRDRIADGKVAAYFEEHRSDFATICLARIDFPDEEGARRTSEKVQNGELDFYEAAKLRFLEVAGGLAGPPCNVFALVRSGGLPPESRADVLTAGPGDVVGPVPFGEGYAVIQVLRSTPARLDEPTRAAIKKILFEDWLAGRREAARIDWNWGSARRAPQRRPDPDLVTRSGPATGE